MRRLRERVRFLTPQSSVQPPVLAYQAVRGLIHGCHLLSHSPMLRNSTFSSRRRPVFPIMETHGLLMGPIASRALYLLEDPAIARQLLRFNMSQHRFRIQQTKPQVGRVSNRPLHLRDLCLHQCQAHYLETQGSHTPPSTFHT
jgi:hypothetical protein